MAPRLQKKNPERPAPRFILVTPAVAEPQAVSSQLTSALGAADVAAMLLRLAAADERSLINCIKTLAAVVQDRGAALLLDGRADLVARSGADGAHLTGIEAFTAAAGQLKPQRIAGAGGLHTRHDAMLAAERGADYVLFGEPDAQGRRPSFDAIVERVAWWAEVFEAPCLGFAATGAEIAPLAAAGADFIALGDFIFTDARGPAAAIAAAAGQFKIAEPAA